MSKKMITTTLALFLLCTAAFGTALQAKASLNWQQEGMIIQPQSNNDFASGNFNQSVNNLAGTNVNYITLGIPYYQTNPSTTDIQAGNNTPSDSALASAIDHIHSKGLHVMLKPELYNFDNEWSANINPPDRTTWFNNYGQMLEHLGQIAQSHGVEEICIGTELIDMSSKDFNGSNTQNWVNMIDNLRGVFSGKLTYSANWGPSGSVDEVDQIGFWQNLDYIGISAYYNLNTADNSVGSLENAWNQWLGQIQAASQNNGNKPVLFTEIGYRSVDNAHTQPWDYNLGGGYNAQEQANDYQALFDYWSKQPFMIGVHLWNWSSDPNAGGSGNTDYTPQNKPAEGVMNQWLGGNGGSTANTSNVPTASNGQTNNNGNNTQPNNTITVTNGYPTVSGNYIDCNGNIDNDMVHHTTDPSDADPAHHVGQNCPAGSYVATH